MFTGSRNGGKVGHPGSREQEWGEHLHHCSVLHTPPVSETEASAMTLNPAQGDPIPHTIGSGQTSPQSGICTYIHLLSSLRNCCS